MTAKMTFGSTRTKPGSPGRALTYMHTEESRIVGFVTAASIPSLDSSAPGRDWRGLLWIALIVFAIATAAAKHLMQ